MQDDLRPVLLEDVVQLLGIADVADAHDGNVGVDLAQLEPEFVQPSLVDLHEHELVWGQVHDLTTEFRAD